MTVAEKLVLLSVSVKVMRNLQIDFAHSQDHETMKALVSAEQNVDALLEQIDADAKTK